MDEAGAPNWAAVAAVSHSANPLPDYITLKYSTISEEEEEGGSLLSSLRKLTVCSTQCRRKRGANSVAVKPWDAVSQRVESRVCIVEWHILGLALRRSTLSRTGQLLQSM